MICDRNIRNNIFVQMVLKIDGLLEKLKIGKSNPTVGLALSGGGARGFFHVGVLMALEKYGVVPQILSGVSAGSIVVTLYAAGLTPGDIVECFMASQKVSHFTEWALPKEGFLKLTKFERMFESWLPVKYLEELSIPTVVCATNFDEGKSVGWAKGEIVPRVMASCSIPIIFSPVKINGVTYVDGGVLRNLPAWAIRRHCNILYGSNCNPLDKNYRYGNSIIDVALRTYHLMGKANSLPDINLCDHIFTAESLSKKRTFDLSDIHKTVMYGYETASRVLESSCK